MLRRQVAHASHALAALPLLLVPAAGQQFQNSPGAFPGTARWTEGVECADVDNDGDLDVFFADGDGFSGAGTQRQNVLYRNQRMELGSLSFVDESVARLGVHLSNGKGLTTGDVNGDGGVDALFANAFNTDPPFLYINQSAPNVGFFTEDGAARGLVGNKSSAGAQFGDLDDDGDLDLVLTDSGASFLGGAGGKPHLYENDGTGSFTEIVAPAWNPPQKIAHMDVQLIDIDLDWDLDVFIANRGSNAGNNHYLLANAGAMTFFDISSKLPATSTNVYEAELGDLDGDTDMDIFWVSLSGFQEGASRNEIEPTSNLAFVNQAALPLSADDNEIALLDYDNDDDLDAFVGSLGSREALWRNNGGLSFSNLSTSIQAISDSTLDMTVGDVDNDGDYDLITAQGESNSPQWANKLYLNNGAPDTRTPILERLDPVADLSNPSGPWVAHAAVRDQVIDDGVNYLEACAYFVANAAPSTASATIELAGFSPMSVNVTVGTLVQWTSNVANATVTSTTAGFAFDSGPLGMGGTFEQSFTRPGVYTFQDTVSGNTGSVVVTGVASKSDATYSRGGIFRFSMGAAFSAVELHYELSVVDFNGNELRVPLFVGSSDPGTPFCFGVGCPCGNDSATTGCLNSSGSGMLLSGAGSTSVAADDLVLTTTGCAPNNTGLYFMGGSTFAPVFVGDGLACTGGIWRYFPGVVSGSGVFTQTTPVANSFAGAINAGDTRHFQSWTRDVLCGPPPAPCPTPCGMNSNLSNGYTVVFTP